MHLIAVYLFYPETQGLHLEAIDQIFLESKNFLEPVRAAERIRAEPGRFAHTIKESNVAGEKATDSEIEGKMPTEDNEFQA